MKFGAAVLVGVVAVVIVAIAELVGPDIFRDSTTNRGSAKPTDIAVRRQAEAAPQSPASASAGLPAKPSGTGEGNGKTMAESPSVSYGQFIGAAIQNDSPTDAKLALDYLRACSVAEKLRESLDKARGGGGISNETMARLVNDSERLLRDCQSVTSDMYQQQQPLADRALLGGVAGVAASYGDTTNFSPPAKMREPLLRGLMADAAAGDVAAMTRLVVHGRDMGLSNIDLYAYYLLAQQTLPKYQAELLQVFAERRSLTELSKEEQLQAETKAKKLRQGFK